MYAIFTENYPLTREEAKFIYNCVQSLLGLIEGDPMKTAIAQSILKKMTEYTEVSDTESPPFG